MSDKYGHVVILAFVLNVILNLSIVLLTTFTSTSAIRRTFKVITSNNRRLESAFDVTRLFVLWQVGEELCSRKTSPGQSRPQALSLCDIIRPCKKICGGCQMCVPRSIDPSTTSPIKSRLESVLGSVLPTSNAINTTK